jgi:hypothetical protein
MLGKREEGEDHGVDHRVGDSAGLDCVRWYAYLYPQGLRGYTLIVPSHNDVATTRPPVHSRIF